MFLLAFLCLAVFIQVQVHAEFFEALSSKCDRAASREASLVISRVIRPRVEAQRYVLPEACPLDTSKDMFAVQEAHKVLMRKNVWKCAWDQKVRVL